MWMLGGGKKLKMESPYYARLIIYFFLLYDIMVQCKAAGFWCWMLCMHSEAFYFFFYFRHMVGWDCYEFERLESIGPDVFK